MMGQTEMVRHDLDVLFVPRDGGLIVYRSRIAFPQGRARHRQVLRPDLLLRA
jgi:hypothetical protein